MPRLLILLTLPPDVTEQYRTRLAQKFPEIGIDVIGLNCDTFPRGPAIGPLNGYVNCA